VFLDPVEMRNFQGQWLYQAIAALRPRKIAVKATSWLLEKDPDYLMDLLNSREALLVVVDTHLRERIHNAAATMPREVAAQALSWLSGMDLAHLADLLDSPKELLAAVGSKFLTPPTSAAAGMTESAAEASLPVAALSGSIAQPSDYTAASPSAVPTRPLSPEALIRPAQRRRNPTGPTRLDRLRMLQPGGTDLPRISSRPNPSSASSRRNEARPFQNPTVLSRRRSSIVPLVLPEASSSTTAARDPATRLIRAPNEDMPMLNPVQPVTPPPGATPSQGRYSPLTPAPAAAMSQGPPLSELATRGLVYSVRRFGKEYSRRVDDQRYSVRRIGPSWYKDPSGESAIVPPNISIASSRRNQAPLTLTPQSPAMSSRRSSSIVPPELLAVSSLTTAASVPTARLIRAPNEDRPALDSAQPATSQGRCDDAPVHPAWQTDHPEHPDPFPILGLTHHQQRNTLSQPSPTDAPSPRAPVYHTPIPGVFPVPCCRLIPVVLSIQHPIHSERPLCFPAASNAWNPAALLSTASPAPLILRTTHAFQDTRHGVVNSRTAVNAWAPYSALPLLAAPASGCNAGIHSTESLPAAVPLNRSSMVHASPAPVHHVTPRTTITQVTRPGIKPTSQQSYPTRTVVAPITIPLRRPGPGIPPPALPPRSILPPSRPPIARARAPVAAPPFRTAPYSATPSRAQTVGHTFKRLQNLGATCATNAAIQCLLATGKSFGGRGQMSSMLRKISFADPSEDLSKVLGSVVHELGLSSVEHQGVADVWDSLCDRIAAEDGTWENFHGTLMSRFQCLSCGHTKFASKKTWCWEIPLMKGIGTVSEGCSNALTVTQNKACNVPDRKDGLSCDACQRRSQIADFRTDSAVGEQWSCGDFLVIRGNWCSVDRPSAILDTQMSPQLTLSGTAYSLFFTICNVGDGTHYVCVILKDGVRWKLDDALPPLLEASWCAGGVPEILVYRRMQHSSPVLQEAQPSPPSLHARSCHTPPRAEDMHIKQVNALAFIDHAPVGGGDPNLRLKTPVSAAEWCKVAERIKMSLPSTLFCASDDPAINCALITDVIHDILPMQPPSARRRPTPQPRHVHAAGDLKSRLRSLCRQASHLGSASAPKTEFSDSLHLYNHYVRTSRAQERFAGLPSAMKKFQTNPAKFAKEVLGGAKSSNAQPIKVTASEAEAFFRATYADTRNDPLVGPPQDTVDPPPLCTPFNDRPISLRELQRLLRKKSNQCAPGPDGIPYTVYKHSEPLQRALVTLFNDVVRTGRVPPSWSVASIVLIPKSAGVTDDVKELRPIALTNTMGKLFTAIFARRLEGFLRANRSWDISQKGFACATQGCIDHSFTLQQALHDSRSRQTNIAVAWLDLKNAFGSISHKMVQYALRQYGVPPKWCQVVFGLYNALCARVVTPNWTTNFFPYQRGVFQGDPLSPVIFNMVFSPVVAQIQAINASPYITQCGASIGLTAYADDLAIVTRSQGQLQRILDDLAPLLTWMRLSFNAKKCVGLVLHRGALVTPAPHFYIGQTPFSTLTGEESFKFLGVHIPASGGHALVFDKVVTAAREWWDAISNANISIPAKLWVFRFSLTRLRWQLAIYDWPLSEVERLQSLANSFLRRWLHLPQAANLYVVFSPRALHIPLITSVFKATQVSKHRSLRDNRDPEVALLHANRHVDRRAKWFVEPAMTAIDTFVAAEDFTTMMLGRANRGHAGLGFRPPFTPFQDPLSRRASRFIAEEECAERLKEVLLLPTYKDLWSAIESDMVQDRHWQRALLGLPDKLLTFVLKAATNSLPTNHNLTIWRKMGSPNCPLCDTMQTPGHILNGCRPALREGRYTFRHDLVLGVFISGCASANLGLSFHFSLDYLSNSRLYTFPFPVSTLLRPDVIVCSKDGGTVWLAELTVPLPHRVSVSNSKKADHYRDLASRVSAATGRTVHVAPWEVTSLGNVAHSTRRLLASLGLTPPQVRVLIVSLAQAAILGSHTVFQHRNAPTMPPQSLLDLLPPLPLATVNPVDGTQTATLAPCIAFTRGVEASLPVLDSTVVVSLPELDPDGDALREPTASPPLSSVLPAQQGPCPDTPLFDDVIRNGSGWVEVKDPLGERLYRCVSCGECMPNAHAAGQHVRRRCSHLVPPSVRQPGTRQALSVLPEPNRARSSSVPLCPSPTVHRRIRARNGWEEVEDPMGGSFYRCLLCSKRLSNAAAAGQHMRRCHKLLAPAAASAPRTQIA